MYFIFSAHKSVGGRYILFCSYMLGHCGGGGAFKNIARRNVNIVNTAREAYFCRIVNFLWTRARSLCGGTQNTIKQMVISQKQNVIKFQKVYVQYTTSSYICKNKHKAYVAGNDEFHIIRADFLELSLRYTTKRHRNNSSSRPIRLTHTTHRQYAFLNQN